MESNLAGKQEMSREEELFLQDLEGDGDAVELKASVSEVIMKTVTDEEVVDVEHSGKTEDVLLEGKWVAPMDIKEGETKVEKLEKDSADHDKTEQKQLTVVTASDGFREVEGFDDGCTSDIHEDDFEREFLSNDELTSIAGDGSDIELELKADDKEFQISDLWGQDESPDQKGTTRSVTEKAQEHTKVKKIIKDGEASAQGSASSDKAKHDSTKLSLATLQNKLCIPGAYFGPVFDKDTKKTYCVRIYQVEFDDLVHAEFLSAWDFCTSIFFSKQKGNTETVELCTAVDKIHKLLDIILFMPWVANDINVEIEYTHKEFPKVQHKATFCQRNLYARMTLKNERMGISYQQSKSNSLFINNLPRGLPKLFLAALFPKGFVGKMGTNDGSAVVHLKNSQVAYDHLISFYDFSINGKKLELRTADVSQEEILRDLNEKELLKKRKEQMPLVKTKPVKKAQTVGPKPDLQGRRDAKLFSASRGRELQFSTRGPTQQERDAWRSVEQNMATRELQKHIELALRQETIMKMESIRVLEKQQQLKRIKLKQMQKLKEMERQRKVMGEVARQREAERIRKMGEVVRQREAERIREMGEVARQREAERIREMEFQRKQLQLEKLKEMEMKEMERRKEQERQREMARQRELQERKAQRELERQREMARQRELQERKRQREIERQRELQEMERREEIRRQREIKEREKLREIERQTAQELERLKDIQRQRAAQEMELQKEMHRQQELKKLREAERLQEMERPRVTPGMERMQRMERQQELQIREAENIREMERLREMELDREIERENQDLGRLATELDSWQGQHAEREMRRQQQTRSQGRGRTHRDQTGEQRHILEFGASQWFDKDFRRGQSEMPRGGRRNSWTQEKEATPGTSRGREGYSAHGLESMAGQGGWKEDENFLGQYHDVTRKRRFPGHGWNEADQQPRKRGGYRNLAQRDSAPFVSGDRKNQLEMEMARETLELQNKLAHLNRLQKQTW